MFFRRALEVRRVSYVVVCAPPQVNGPCGRMLRMPGRRFRGGGKFGPYPRTKVKISVSAPMAQQ